MRRAGLIGGTSWESTVIYYKQINEQIAHRLGGLHSADIVLRSLDFQPIVDLQAKGDWDSAATLLANAGQDLKQAGAGAIVICANTMHIVAEKVEAHTGLPVIHIVDAVVAKLKALGLKRLGLLGTRFTMEMPFYQERFRALGVELVIPDEEDRKNVHRIIYEELCKGIFTDASRLAYLEIIGRLQEQQIEGVILGCTEIGLLLPQNIINLPLLDTATIHADAIVDWMLGSQNLG